MVMARVKVPMKSLESLSSIGLRLLANNLKEKTKEIKNRAVNRLTDQPKAAPINRVGEVGSEINNSNYYKKAKAIFYLPTPLHSFLMFSLDRAVRLS